MTSSPRVYWLSFSDSDRPDGQRNLGVCLVEVTPLDVVAFRPGLYLRFPSLLSLGPEDLEEAEWVGAAVDRAHRAHCNPGGDVSARRLDHLPTWPIVRGYYPLRTLLQRDQVEAIDAVMQATSTLVPTS